MRHRIMNSPLFLKLIPYAMIGIGLIIMYSNMSTNAKKADESRESGKAVRVYNISSNCFQSIPADDRDQAWIKYCYDRAEAIVGVKVERFGLGKD